MTNQGEKRTGYRPGATEFILAGVLLGVGWGIFFGPAGAWIGVIGDIYVGLLQMTVLPYVAASLVANLGRLTLGQGGRLAIVSLLTLGALWLVGFLMLGASSFAFPASHGGSFFSSSLIEPPPKLDWQELFVPSNPFWSLARNLVPAVVVFSIGLGVAMMGLPKNESVLGGLDVLLEALARLNRYVVKASPIGIFAIVGDAAGTLSLEQFGLMQGYLLVYGAGALVLCFWVLPALVATVTPFRHREILGASREMLMVSFILGNTFVVLPMITEAVRKLMADHRIESRSALHRPEYLVPLAYPFPDVGRIVGLVFVPFAAWFYGQTIEPGRFAELMGVGFLGSFAKPVVTIPLVLNIARIPTDIFDLFLASGIVASRFGDAMKAVHLLAFAIIVSAVMTGTFRVHKRGLVARGVATVGLVAGVVLSMQLLLSVTFGPQYSREKLLTARTLLSEQPQSKVVTPAEATRVPPVAGEDPIDRIRRAGVLRVGFDPGRLPFTYYNLNGDLVGFDVDMAHELASDLGVELEFVPSTEDFATPLENGDFDIAMSRVESTVRRAQLLPATRPYLQVTAALVVPDHLRTRYDSLKKLREAGPLRVAVVANCAAAELPFNEFPNLQVKTIGSDREFFESSPPIADVLATNAESGAAWTLKYPEYAVVKPVDVDLKVPLIYAVAEESQLSNFVETWVAIQVDNGDVDWFYDYWVLGKDEKDQPPRWSVIRDVLGWID